MELTGIVLPTMFTALGLVSSLDERREGERKGRGPVGGAVYLVHPDRPSLTTLRFSGCMPLTSVSLCRVVTLNHLLWLPLSYPQQAEETSLTGHSSLAFPCFLYSGQERGHRTMSPHSDEHASTTRFLSSAHLYSSQYLDAPEHLTSVFRAMHKGRVHILECFIIRESWSGAVVQ